MVLAFRGAGSLIEAWRRLALPVAVIIAAGHMAKGLAKIASWGGYLPLALRNPDGRDSAAAITSGAVTKPAHLLPLPAVSIIGLVLLAAMIVYALRESRLADETTHRTRIASILVLGFASAFLVCGWGFFQ